MDATTSTTFDFSKQFFLAVLVCGLGWYVLSAADWTLQNVKISLVGEQQQQHLTENAESKPQPVAYSAASAESNPNSAAPRSTREIADAAANDYIARLAPVAVAEMQKFGIPASILLAQGLVECAAGTSTGCRKAKNHFGVKCFAKHHRWCCIKAHDDNNTDSFVIYTSDWASWRAHSKLLAGPRYGQLIGKDAEGWARGLKRLGYATDPNYDSKLLSVIEKFKLDRFDQ